MHKVSINKIISFIKSGYQLMPQQLAVNTYYTKGFSLIYEQAFDDSL